MKKRTFLKASLLPLFILTGISSLNAQNMAHHSTNWGYMGKIGPNHWGELDKKFAMCSEGKMQSPINVVANKKVGLKPLNLEYNSDAKSVINNGHTIKVNVKDGSSLKVDGETYKLKQFHFHVPSENNINGNAYPLEVHFVHSTDDGKLAVVAVMFEENKDNKNNPTLEKIWKNLSHLKVGEEKKLNFSSKDIQALIPKNSKYYRFMGSLTTPPCSENVKWFVYKTPLSVSKEQVVKFFAQFGFPNNRPIQATNGRVIEE